LSVFILKIFDMSRGQVICFNFWSGLILHATTATQVRTHSGVRTPLLELLCLNFSFKFWPSTVKRSISPFLTCHIFPSRVTIKKKTNSCLRHYPPCQLVFHVAPIQLYKPTSLISKLPYQPYLQFSTNKTDTEKKKQSKTNCQTKI
jgi:hypothetical protein